jgi:membrane protein required for colicin V production
MTFTIVDLVLIVIVLIFVIVGFMMGLIEAVGAIVGIFLGAWVAGNYYQPFASWLVTIFLGHQIAANIVSFILIFTLVHRLTTFLFYLINKAFNIIAIIPFLGPINKMAGAILGLAEGVLAVGLLLYVVSRFAGSITWVTTALGQAQTAFWLVKSASMLIALLPPEIMQMASVFNF